MDAVVFRRVLDEAEACKVENLFFAAAFGETLLHPQAIDFLKASIKGDGYKEIREGIERLDKATRRFAELMMDDAVLGAVQGKTMEAAGESMGQGPTAPHPFAKAEINRE